MARTLVAHVDSAGIPRAWAVADKPEEARERADRNLEHYLAGDSDTSGQAPYRVHEQELEEDKLAGDAALELAVHGEVQP